MKILTQLIYLFTLSLTFSCALEKRSIASLAPTSEEAESNAIFLCNSWQEGPLLEKNSKDFCIENFKNHVEEWCLDTQWKDIYLSFNFPLPSLSSDLKNNLLKKIKLEQLKAWDKSVIPLDNIKKDVMNDESRKKARDIIKKNQLAQLNDHFFSEMKDSKIYSSKLADMRLPLLKACYDFGSSSNNECADALSELKKITQTKDAYALINHEKINFSQTLLPLTQKILSDHTYHAAIIKTAIKILDDIDGHKNDSNEFEDLKSAFMDQKIPIHMANEKALEVMAFIATAGPNLYLRLEAFLGEKESALKSALDVLARAAVILDWNQKGHGHFYTLPPAITSLCPFNKTYHFWMSAYLTHELKKLNYPNDISASAVYLLEKGYQMLSETPGHHPTYIYKEPVYGAFNNVIRIDTILSMAGSLFGINLELGKPINIDDYLIRSLEKAKVPWKDEYNPDDLLKDLLLYNRFQKIFQFDDLFKEMATEATVL